MNVSKDPSHNPQQPSPQTSQQQSSQLHDTQPFQQFVQTVKSQVRCAKEIHDLLVDCCKRLSEPPSSNQQSQPAQYMQQQATGVDAVAQLAASTQQQTSSQGTSGVTGQQP